MGEKCWTSIKKKGKWDKEPQENGTRNLEIIRVCDRQARCKDMHTIAIVSQEGLKAERREKGEGKAEGKGRRRTLSEGTPWRLTTGRP